MTWSEAASLVGAVLGAAAIALSAWLTRRGNVEVKRVEAEAAKEAAESAPYDQLSDRVAKLEAQVSALLSDQWVDRTYMRQLLAAWPLGHPLPLPMPEWIALHYGIQPQHPPTPGTTEV